MLDIKELEQRQRSYALKKRLMPIVIIVSSVVIVFGFGYVFSTAETEKKVIQKPAAVIKPVAAKPKPVIEVNNTKVAEVTQEQTVLSPAMDFMQNVKNHPSAQIVQPATQIRTVVVQVPAPVVQQKIVEPIKESSVSVVKQPEITRQPEAPKITHKADSAPKTSINIERSGSGSEIDQVIKRFQANQNPSLSLFVAKKSYEMGDYHQALNYALITNKIKSDIADSWIIFAKSLVKLGRKEEAVKTLKEYTAFSGSTEAKQLIDDINSGRFK